MGKERTNRRKIRGNKPFGQVSREKTYEDYLKQEDNIPLFSTRHNTEDPCLSSPCGILTHASLIEALAGISNSQKKQFKAYIDAVFEKEGTSIDIIPKA